MHSSARLKYILGGIAFLLAFISLSLPFRYQAALMDSDLLPGYTNDYLRQQTSVTGLDLLIPSFSLVFYFLVLILLFRGSGKIFGVILSVLNLAFMFVIYMMLKYDITLFAESMKIDIGFYVLCFSAILLFSATAVHLYQQGNDPGSGTQQDVLDQGSI